MKPRMALTAAALVAALCIPALWLGTAEAQRRGGAGPVRPGPPVRVAPPRASVVVGGFYRPRVYASYPWHVGIGVGFGWSQPYGWYPYGPYPYGWYAPYGYGYAWPYEGSVRIRAPREADVFVDGYYAGRVDDFDGSFQRLRVEPGEHDIQIYLAGFRPVSQRIYVQPGKTFNLRAEMEQLGPGEPEAERPLPPESSAPASRDPRVPPGREPRPPTAGQPAEFGAVAIQVQPAEAEVFIDGERWQGPGLDEELVVQVAPGRHRIEIRREGYGTFTSEIDVVAGEASPLNVSLPRQ